MNQLVKARQDLKKKYKTLKSDIVKSQTNLEKSYHPITKPLKQLIETIQKSEPITPKFEISTPKLLNRSSLMRERKYKQAPQNEPSELDSRNITPRTLYQPTMTETVYEASGNDATLPDMSGSPTQQYIDESIRQFADLTRDENVVFKEYLSQYDELPRVFIKESIQDTEGNFDHRFGIRHDFELDKFSIGDSEITFDGPDMIIKKIRYKGTPGLYELLLKKNPLGYTKKDEEEYRDIMKRTNALYTRHDPKLPLMRSTKDTKTKYERVIQPIKGRSRSGSAPTIQTRSKVGKGNLTLMKINKYPLEYKYFDDYNEIVDRLKLLLASEAAGNNAHNNEIVSILEELKEAGIIK